MSRARSLMSYGYLLLLASAIGTINFVTRSYTASHPDSLVEVGYLILAAIALSVVDVRLERGRLTLSALSSGASAILLNPLNASLVGLATAIAMRRRSLWVLVANSLMTGLMTTAGSGLATIFRGQQPLSVFARIVVLGVVFGTSLTIVSTGLSLRSGESITSIARHNFTAPFLLAYGYFTLGALLISYLVDGSLIGYLLASIVFVLALALTDTIAGRRVRRVLESELTDADRHLFHSRAVEGVVHNLRNHMATAVGYLKEIDTTKLDRVEADAVDTAKAAANDAVTVLQSLSQGATPRVTYASESVDLNQLVSLALDMARPRARPKRVELRLQETPDDVKVRADPLLLREVATNLINNAIDAAPDTGHVVVSTGRRGGSPYFNVADNGPGVTDENRHHLFEPHFTTKEHGTGLGLFMSYGIVREHQGQLLYEGNRKGAAFTVVLPPFSG